MKRRAFIAGLGANAISAMPRAAAQLLLPKIGYLSFRSEALDVPLIQSLLRGLTESGSVEGRDFAIRYRYAEGQRSQLEQLAAEYGRLGLSVIVAGDSSTALATKRATANIPTVFFSGGDPSKLGLVASFNRPGGMLTGVAQLNHAITAKRLELLRELVPDGKSVAFFHDAKNASAADEPNEVLAAAKDKDQELHVIPIARADDLPKAFEQAASLKVHALLVGSGPVFTNNRRTVVELAAERRIPAAYSLRDFAEDGGLVSYGSSIRDGFLQMGRYVGRILKGEKPADLPVVQPTQFNLVINLRTAKALGLTIPPTLLATADEVIE
jgi:putative ABC transport system substrate-binding protein